MDKVVRHYAGDVRAAIMRARFAGRFSPASTYVLTSSPRSGSTLLADLLKRAIHATVVFEPLSPQHVPGARAAGFEKRSWRAAGEAWPEGEAFLARIFSGDVIDRWTSREMTFADLRKPERQIVKFVRATRLLPWMCSRFSLPAPVMLLRHPCAVVASQLRYGWQDWAKPPVKPAYLSGFPAFGPLLDSLDQPESWLAAEWALDQIPALSAPRPYPWAVVTYEDVCADPALAAGTVLSRWGYAEARADLAAEARRPSRTVNRAGISGLAGWQKSLSPKQIDLILGTVRRFGLLFYGPGAEPDRDALADPDLPARIRAAGGALAAA